MVHYTPNTPHINSTQHEPYRQGMWDVARPDALDHVHMAPSRRGDERIYHTGRTLACTGKLIDGRTLHGG